MARLYIEPSHRDDRLVTESVAITDARLRWQAARRPCLVPPIADVRLQWQAARWSLSGTICKGARPGTPQLPEAATDGLIRVNATCTSHEL